MAQWLGKVLPVSLNVGNNIAKVKAVCIDAIPAFTKWIHQTIHRLLMLLFNYLPG